MTAIPCQHWSDCGVQAGGCCALGKYGGRPGRGVCLSACLKLVSPPAATPPPEHWGTRMWRELHAHEWSGNVVTDQMWLCAWMSQVPCGDCKTHANWWVATNPPGWTWEWGWRFHNAVNVRRGGAGLTLEAALVARG